jgi:hypothetical protein
MEAVLVAFFNHPTAQGAFIAIAAFFCYGVIKLTILATRGTIALEGIQAGLLKQGEEHTKTRADVAAVKTDVAELKTKVDGHATSVLTAVRGGLETAATTIVKAVGEEGQATRDAYAEKRLSDISKSVKEVAQVAREALDSVTEEAPAPKRSATGSGRAVRG